MHRSRIKRKTVETEEEISMKQKIFLHRFRNFVRSVRRPRRCLITRLETSQRLSVRLLPPVFHHNQLVVSQWRDWKQRRGTSGKIGRRGIAVVDAARHS